MAQMTAQERLVKLQREADQMSARLEAAKAVVRNEERQKDTRRKAIIGGLVIKLLREGERIPQNLDGFLRMVTRDHDRKAFEGWSPVSPDFEEETPKKEVGAELPVSSDQPTTAAES